MNKLFCTITGFVALLLVVACNQPTPAPSTAAPETESTTLNTRSTQQRIEAAAYHYKTLASFRDGEVQHLADAANLAGKKVNFVILYEALAPWAEGFSTGEYTKTGDDHLNGLMEVYSLEIVKQFAIDDENEGLVLEPNKAIENPIDAAKELSLIDHVLMVEVKEVPPAESNSTANVH